MSARTGDYVEVVRGGRNGQFDFSLGCRGTVKRAEYAPGGSQLLLVDVTRESDDVVMPLVEADVKVLTTAAEIERERARLEAQAKEGGARGRVGKWLLGEARCL